MADDLRQLLSEIYGDEEPGDVYRNPRIRSPKSDPWRIPEREPPPPPELRNAAPARPDAATAPVSRTLAEGIVGTARMPYDIPHDTAQSVADLLQRHYGEAALGAGTVASQFIPIPGAPKGKPRPPRMPELRAAPGQTVTKPYRPPLFPVYDDPKQMVSEPRIAPETGAMKEVFGGVRDPNTGELFEGTRGHLAEIGEHGRRKGNMTPEEVVTYVDKPRGAELASKIMNPRNEQRMHDILEEAGKIPGMRIGMDNWYVMDPAYWRLVELYGPEEGLVRYNHFNHMVGMASPGTNVIDEIKRGSLAHFMDSQGRFPEFAKYATYEKQSEKFPNAPYLEQLGITGVPGHLYSTSSHAGPMGRYLEAGREMQSQQPKVPAYVHASGVPGTIVAPGRFQTGALVGDAHWSRGVGLADARHGPTDIGASYSRSEAQSLIPWWAKITAQHGIEPVPGQARTWGALSSRTGVDTDIGMPKLELIAQHIQRRARELGWPIDVTRDMILSGDMYALGGSV